MEDSLSQPGKKLGIIYRILAATGLSLGSGMKKNQVKVGVIPEFKPTKLPIGNDRKSPPKSFIASRITARSTTAGTPVKS